MNYIKINGKLYDIKTLSFEDYNRLAGKPMDEFIKDGGVLVVSEKLIVKSEKSEEFIDTNEKTSDLEGITKEVILKKNRKK